MKTRFDGFFRNIQTGGGFGAGHLFHRAQHEHGPKLVGQRVDGALQNGAQLMVVHLLFRTAGRLR